MAFKHVAIAKCIVGVLTIVLTIKTRLRPRL